MSINKNIKGEFSISFSPTAYTHDVAKKIVEENILRRIKSGEISSLHFSSNISYDSFFNVLARASCLYDMIPFLFPLPDRMARAYNISQYIHARCACKRALNEMLNGKFFFIVFSTQQTSRSVHNFFLVCTYSVCEGEKKQKK